MIIAFYGTWGGRNSGPALGYAAEALLRLVPIAIGIGSFFQEKRTGRIRKVGVTF